MILPLALLLVAQAPAVPPPAPTEKEVIHQIKPHLWMVTGAGGNVTVFQADHGLVLVDDKIKGDQNFDGLVAAVRSVSTLQVLAVFNTHHHWDHIGNNDKFVAAQVMVIGTPQTAEQIAEATPPGTPPTVEYTKDFALLLQGGRVEAHHYGPGHTGGDTVVYFPGSKVVSAGGLVVNDTPTIDYEGGANLGGWLRALDAMSALDWDMAVPGKGPPMTRADVAQFRSHIATFRARALAAVHSGTPKSKLIASIRVDDLGWKWGPRSWPEARVDGLWNEMRTNGAK